MLNRIKNLRNLIGSTFRPVARTGREFVLRENDFGRIHLDTNPVQRIVERMQLEGVHEIKNVIVNTPTSDSPLSIKLDLIIEQDYPAPQLGANLRDAIKTSLRENFGIMDAIFDIRVMNINQALPDKTKPRVR